MGRYGYWQERRAVVYGAHHSAAHLRSSVRKFSPRELPPPLTALPALYGRIFVIFALKFTPDLLSTQSLPQRLC